MHFDNGKYVVIDMRVLRFILRERVGVEHDDESSNGQASVNCSEKDETDQGLDLWAVLLQLHEGRNWYCDDHGACDQVEHRGTHAERDEVDARTNSLLIPGLTDRSTLEDAD